MQPLLSTSLYGPGQPKNPQQAPVQVHVTYASSSLPVSIHHLSGQSVRQPVKMRRHFPLVWFHPSFVLYTKPITFIGSVDSFTVSEQSSRSTLPLFVHDRDESAWRARVSILYFLGQIYFALKHVSRLVCSQQSESMGDNMCAHTSTCTNT